MEKHPKFAANQIMSHEGKADLDRLWQALSNYLNKLEGPTKEVEAWKAVSYALQFSITFYIFLLNHIFNIFFIFTVLEMTAEEGSTRQSGSWNYSQRVRKQCKH